MSIPTKCARLMSLLALWSALLCTPSLSQAQEEVNIPVEVEGGMPTDPGLQDEIDKVLGISERRIKQGIKDPGVDIANLVINKALDELIKGIADASVLAPVAEKIMSAYQKTKDKRLVKKLASLRDVWKDGQERLNKLNYQDFKLRYEWARQHNEENNAIKQSIIKGLESEMTKDIWGTQVMAINQTYDNGGPTSQMIKKYLDKGQEDLGYYNLVVINSSLGSTDLIKARNKFGTSKGKPVFLSPYERLKLQQKSLEEAKQRHADLVNYGRQVAASMNYYRLAESERATRSMLSKTISDPYLARYAK
ncbi:hypothetical protein BN8_p06790 (plasmid) [Fibrisoma limi BUZ 3]|uniref:SurA domain protein n=1 Tax=Fibrisoma limi BUZ 3 TaxID=1185876 RepID=I2GTZ6_9BACT|nr:hypothetical protein [Fibrisoma limi]CCH57597.1 hypothetical protein BN8_p06790 [Fibrisoma limi BUZ 3]